MKQHVIVLLISVMLSVMFASARIVIEPVLAEPSTAEETVDTQEETSEINEDDQIGQTAEDSREVDYAQEKEKEIAPTSGTTNERPKEQESEKKGIFKLFNDFVKWANEDEYANAIVWVFTFFGISVSFVVRKVKSRLERQKAENDDDPNDGEKTSDGLPETIAASTDARIDRIEFYHIPSSKDQYRIVGSLAYPILDFVGREKELEKIDDQLRAIDNKVFLVGMGGIGKSEIARMYIKRYASNYNVILWTDFSKSLQETLADDARFSIDGLSHTYYPADSQREYALRKMGILKSISDRKTLIIIDNYDVQIDQDLESFCSGQHAIIFTTRYHQPKSRIQEIEIPRMTDQKELMKIFCSEYNKPMEANDEQNIINIMELLEGHTLTIRLVASTMQTKRIIPERMLQMLQQGVNKNKDKDLSERVFERLKAIFSFASLIDSELYIMKNLSLISNKGIGVETLYKWCEIDDYDIIDGLVQRNWIIRDPVSDIVRLHPLISQLMLEKINDDPQCCEKMLGNFNRQANNVARAPLAIKYLYYDVAKSAWERLPETHPLRTKMLQTRIETQSALSLHRQAIVDSESLIENAQSLEQKLYAYNKMSQSYTLLGEFDMGLKKAEEGYELLKEYSLDNLNRDQGYLFRRLLGRLMEANNMLGNYEVVLDYSETSYKYSDKYYGTCPNDSKGWAKTYKARALYNLGRLEEGENEIRTAIDHFNAANEKWSKCFADMTFSMFLAHKGDTEEALNIIDSVIEILSQICGFEHLDVARAMEYKAKIYVILHDRENADKYWKQSSDIFTKVGAKNRVAIIESERDKFMSEENCFLPIV